MKPWSATRRCTWRLGFGPTAPRRSWGCGEQTEGAKFWLRVMTELKNRGVEDVLIAVVDGLKGFPEAITAVFPEATVQTCIVHTIRTQLPDGLHGTVVTGLRRWTQWDDMTDLKATVAHDDALDDKLQDGLLVGKGCLVQARVDAIAERRQVHPHGFGSQPLLA